MVTMHVELGQPDARAKLERCLQNFAESVLRGYDAGLPVAVHMHSSCEEIGPEMLCGVLVHDFRYTGWTFGVSVGDYPKARRRLVHSPTPDEPITVRLPLENP